MWKKNTYLGTFSQREAILCPEMVALDTMPGDVPFQSSVLIPTGGTGTFTMWKKDDQSCKLESMLVFSM